MPVRNLLSVLLFILQVSFSKTQTPSSSNTLVISLDAFRHDYVLRIRELVEQNGQESNLWRLIRNGAHALNGISTTFTTLTLPIHYTIATGLYEESHGVIGNVIYDPVLNQTIDLAHSPQTANRSWVYTGGEPIWKTLRQQTSVAINQEIFGCLQWTGCEAGNLSRWVPFRNDSTLGGHIDQAVEWLLTGSRLVMIYYQQPDMTGHTFGPESKELNQTLIMLDAKIGYLLQKLESTGLMGTINLIIMADHGMIEVKGAALANVQLPQDMFYLRSWAQPIWLVEPKGGRFSDTVSYFKSFSNVEVIPKDQTPLRWHYRNNDRITPLIIMSTPGYTLNNTGARGTHGYDNALPDMRPMFIAHGPAFIPKSSVPEEMSTVDVYLLLCKLLNLKPAPNNGTREHLVDFVKAAYLMDLDAYSAVTDDQTEKAHTHKGDNEEYNAALIVMCVCITITIVVLLIILCYALVQSVRPSTKPSWRDRVDATARQKLEYQAVGGKDEDSE